MLKALLQKFARGRPILTQTAGTPSMFSHQNHQYKSDFEAGKSTGEILASSKGGDWRFIFAKFPGSFELVASEDPKTLRATLRRAIPSVKAKAWTGLFTADALRNYSADYRWGYKEFILPFAELTKTLQVETLALVRPELAYELACVYEPEKYDLSDPELVNRLRYEPMRSEVAHLLEKSARMWLGLRRLSETNGYSERDKVGRLAIENFVMQLVEDSPILWAESLHIILDDAELIGDIVEAITISLAQKSDDVYDALKFIADQSDGLGLREHARGLLLLVEGFDRPQPETVQRLLDQLARWANAGVLFPHPLSQLSATWMTSNDAERQLRSGLSLGLAEFKRDFSDQGTKNERALVQSLLTELSVPFRNDRPVVRALGQFMPGVRPKITLDHRTLVESEETIYGPDIAFIVNAEFRSAMTLSIAEFVQVKKPNRVRGMWTDSWKIDADQLDKLLNTSMSASYWLIDHDGTVLALPAKLIRAWMPIRAGKSFTVRLNDVRSAAIPIDQFLTELLVGVWIGNTHPVAMKIARGEVPGLIPRNLVEVRVSLHRQEKG